MNNTIQNINNEKSVFILNYFHTIFLIIILISFYFNFIKNIESVDKDTLSMLNNKQIKKNNGSPLSSNLGDINYYKEKIYYDFLPMFSTMIGIIENQEKEINKLKMKIEKKL